MTIKKNEAKTTIEVGNFEKEVLTSALIREKEKIKEEIKGLENLMFFGKKRTMERLEARCLVLDNLMEKFKTDYQRYKEQSNDSNNNTNDN